MPGPAPFLPARRPGRPRAERPRAVHRRWRAVRRRERTIGAILPPSLFPGGSTTGIPHAHVGVERHRRHPITHAITVGNSGEGGRFPLRLHLPFPAERRPRPPRVPRHVVSRRVCSAVPAPRMPLWDAALPSRKRSSESICSGPHGAMRCCAVAAGQGRARLGGCHPNAPQAESSPARCSAPARHPRKTTGQEHPSLSASRRCGS